MPIINEPEYTPTRMLRHNPGMIRDCYWDGEFFVIRQISADPTNGQDGMKIKLFRLGPEEWPVVLDVLRKYMDGFEK